MAKKNSVLIPKNLLILFCAILVIGVLVVFSLLSNYFRFLRRAHSSFENYYAFRGCTELLQKTDTFGVCKTDEGNTIKIVKFDNRWFLDGDLPVCTLGLCF